MSQKKVSDSIGLGPLERPCPTAPPYFYPTHLCSICPTLSYLLDIPRVFSFKVVGQWGSKDKYVETFGFFRPKARGASWGTWGTS